MQLWVIFNESGWVSGGLPSYDGEILAVVRVAPNEDPAARLARTAREGLRRVPGSVANHDDLGLNPDTFRVLDVQIKPSVSSNGCEDRDIDAVFGAKDASKQGTGEIRCELRAAGPSSAPRQDPTREAGTQPQRPVG
jgi:hypothetical protein